MLKASWIITTRCNFHCPHCYLSCTSKPYEQVDRKSAKKIVGIFQKLGVKLVFISGGEPLLYPYLFEIISLLRKNNIVVSVCTNGSLITPSIAQKLKRSGVHDVSISVESVDPKKYQLFRGDTFNRVTTGIDTCIREGIGVSLDVTVTAANIDDVWDIIRYGKTHKTGGIVLKRFIPLGRGKENIRTFALSGKAYAALLKKWLSASVHKKYGNFQLLAHEPIFSVLINTKLKEIPYNLRTFSVGCRGGIISFGVFLDGHFTYCPIISKYHSLGNILTMDIEKIQRILSDNPIMKRQMHESGCRTCGNFPYCRGCRSSAFAVSGRLMAEDPLCWQKIQTLK